MYSYNDLLAGLPLLEKAGADVCYIGSSVCGRKIPMVHTGSYSGKQILIQGAIHAREHITAKLVVMMAQNTPPRKLGTPLTERGINYQPKKFPSNLEGWHEVTGCLCGAYFIPMTNPDGVSLCQSSADFSLWKANIRGVDLNCNFPARWGTGAQNVFKPAPESYVGPCAASEPETRALMEITKKIRPALTISYHCKGREIYWQFHQTGKRLLRDKAIAERFAAETGYTLIDGERGSAGGYKDWCIEKMGIPAFTFEIVDDKYAHPVPYSVLDEEYRLNKNIPRLALEAAHGDGSNVQANIVSFIE